MLNFHQEIKIIKKEKKCVHIDIFELFLIKWCYVKTETVLINILIEEENFSDKSVF